MTRLKQVLYFCLLLMVTLPGVPSAFGQCAVNQTFTVNPMPQNGTYMPGQVVSVCFTSGSFQQLGANWIHGFVFNLGSGWDASTIAVTQMPNTCSGSGVWGLYNSSTGTQSGLTYGPGVYYDFSNQYIVADGVPGNNFGDQNINNACSWVLCFDIAVGNSCSNGDLSLGITVTGDGSSGSWGNASCAGVLFPILTNVQCASACNMTLSPVSTNPGCGSNGSAGVTIGGGTGPYQCLWSNGATTPSLAGLGAGIYLVTVTDANNCQQTTSVQLSAQDSSGVAIQTTQEISCTNYCNGQLTAIATAGAGPYTFQWSNGTTTASIANVCNGTYTVTLVDGNQCSAVASAALANPPGLNVTVQTQPASCFGATDGTATAIIQSAQPVVNISWNPAGQVSATAVNLPAGVYTVTVTDANGCTIGGSGTVTQPPKIVFDIIASDASCNGASDAAAIASALSGTAPYYYQWSTNATTPFIDALQPGVYHVTVTDAMGCSSDTLVVLSEPQPIVLNMDAQPAGCETVNDGSVSVAVFGGAPGFVYQWNTAGISTGTLINLAPGFYSVTVTDANGCTATGHTHVVSKAIFRVTTVDDLEVVRGQSIELYALVDLPGMYTFTWFPDHNLVGQGFDHVTVQPDTTTTYTVLVTDISGCQNSSSVTVRVLSNVNISVPNAFSPNADGHNDLFFPIPGEGTRVTSFRVYDKWGKKLHDSLGAPGWNGHVDGKPCAMGVYTYYCEYNTPSGTPSRKQGTVLLMR